MIKITHYEVYIDKGTGWQLLERFTAEQRQDAFNLAKEKEVDKLKVKIIKEIFDVQDNSYQESVEYVSNLGGIKTKSSGSNWMDANDKEEDFVPPEVTTPLSRTSVLGVIIKLALLIALSLVFANLFVSLMLPILETFIPEESSRPILFGIFFIVFLAMSVPLLIKSLPWYVFLNNQRKEEQLKEQKFYTRAENLIQAYNINSDKEPITASAYPEAPIEYRQYIISFLSELISHLDTSTPMQNRFSRLGIKLLVFGGCLELARYSGLTMSEANSVLFDALKIIDGNSADLEAFYEAKKTYKDNKVAVFLTGVGANLMSQVINGLPISDNLLNIAFNKWVSQDQNPKIEPADLPQPPKDTQPKEHDNKNLGKDIIKTSLVSIKSDLKFMDNSIPEQEKIAIDVSSQIRNIIYNLQNKYSGTDIIEDKGITTVRFSKLNNALKFADEVLKDIETYRDEVSNDVLLMRDCIAITPYKANEEPNLSPYLADMFEHIYNNEIVVNKEIYENINDENYKWDFLGEKTFKNLNTTEELYKLISA